MTGIVDPWTQALIGQGLLAAAAAIGYLIAKVVLLKVLRRVLGLASTGPDREALLRPV